MADNIYKTKQGEKAVKELYDKQDASLGMDYEDLYVDTGFGKTHVIKTGKPDAEPLLLFHGGNSTAAYSLKRNLDIIRDYLVFAPDTIGHPGKSDQRFLSSKNLEYGQWASDLIESLGLKKVNCLGESFGGGILARLMCVSPEKVSRAVLLVPAGIHNALKAKLIFSMGIPMALYILTKKEKWFTRAFSPMANPDEPMDEDTLEMIRTSFHHVKVNPDMPANITREELGEYNGPVLLIAGEKDVLFPGEKVIDKAGKLFPNVEAHLLKDCGHLYFSSEERIRFIKNLVDRFLTG